MDLALTAEQEQLVDAFGGLFEKAAGPEGARAAEPVGHDPALWVQLGELGSVAMAVAEDAGGWGATPLDLALVAEVAGRHLAPAPVIDTQVAARLLARLSSSGSVAAADLLAAALDGSALVTLALHPVRDGELSLVPAGAVADHVVALDGERLVAVAAATQEPRRVDNLGGLPLADLAVPDEAVELASGTVGRAAFEGAIDDWLLLHASTLVGIGSRAVELASEYATERHAWGVPIGTFQGVSHPLADSATALDAARLLVRKAAWLATVAADPAQAAAARGDTAPLGIEVDRAPELAAMAFGLASEAARDATYRALHTHGGYGFMLEQDVQLYYRRARGWPRVWGDAGAAYRRAGAYRYGAAVRDETEA